MDTLLILTHPSVESLTPRQKRLVALRLLNPLASNASLIRAAGYGRGVDKSSGQKVLHSAKVQRALRELLLEAAI